jgi:hypothetical protein
MGERFVSHAEQLDVSAAVERMLRQRFPVGGVDQVRMTVPITVAGLRRLAGEVARVVSGPVDADAATVRLDLEVLIVALQELVVLVLASRLDDVTARTARPLVEAAHDAAELLADLGRPVTAEMRMEWAS